MQIDNSDPNQLSIFFGREDDPDNNFLGVILMLVISGVVGVVVFSEFLDRAATFLYKILSLFPFVLFIGFFIYVSVHQFRRFFKGEHYIFDSSTQSIYRNGKRRLHFDEVELVRLEILIGRRIPGTSYILSLKRHTNSKLFIESSRDKDQILEAARCISDFIGVPFQRGRERK